MEHNRFATVQHVVEARLCTQCGTCVGICPSGAVSMVESPGGMLQAQVRSDGCQACGDCVKVCPGLGMEVGLPLGVDPFEGTVLNAYLGHATNAEVRAGGQSGGVGSALAIHLLSAGLIDAALLTAMPDNGSLRPVAVLARNAGEVLAAQGSKYFSGACTSLLGSLRSTDRRVATFTLPCQTQGIQKMQRAGLGNAAVVSYRVGLFCDRILLRTCTEQMLRDAGIGRDEVALVRYRSKKRSGWPGEVQIVTKSGEERFFPPSLRTNLKEVFTPPRCRLCFDKANVFADVVLGDPWGVSGDKAGDSIMVTRTAEGEALVRGALADGLITMRAVPKGAVMQNLRLEERREAVALFLRLWAESGRVPPDYGDLFDSPLPSASTGIRRAQRRLLRLNCRLAEGVDPQTQGRIVRRYRAARVLRSRIARLVGLLSWGHRGPPR